MTPRIPPERRDVWGAMFAIMRSHRCSLDVAEAAVRVIAAEIACNRRLSARKSEKRFRVQESFNDVTQVRQHELAEFGDMVVDAAWEISSRLDSGIGRDIICDLLRELEAKLSTFAILPSG